MALSEQTGGKERGSAKPPSSLSLRGGSSMYIDFPAFLDSLSAAQREALGRARVHFSYPVLDANEFELIEQPISQRLLMAILGEAGAQVDSEICFVGSDIRFQAPESGDDALPENLPDFVVIHPQIAIKTALPALVRTYRSRFPNAKIVLQNSDQHQHEKLIGGPGGADIARGFLRSIPEIDWIMVGYAEHSLLSLIIGAPTQAVIGQNGAGGESIHIFRFDSLPSPDIPADMADDRSRSIRVQRSRGCLAPCTYCIEGQGNRTLRGELPWEGLDMDAFVDRLEALERQGYFFINIIDSSFEDPGRRGIRDLVAFCEMVVARKLKLSFKIHLRAESVLKLTAADLKKMKGAGIDVIIIGIESGNQEELDYYRKLASKSVSREAFDRIEAPGHFCIILGYIMFTPITDPDMLREKVVFLRDISRGWDFLSLTNSLRVFYGTAIHDQLKSEGLADDETAQPGYVDIRFRHPEVGDLERFFNGMRVKRPGFSRLNNLIYDAMNLESRMLNPANGKYLDMAEERFGDFQRNLAARQSRLSEMFCAGFLAKIDDPSVSFLADFDPDREFAEQEKDVHRLLEPMMSLPEPPSTLQLHTWLSAFDRFGLKSA